MRFHMYWLRTVFFLVVLPVPVVATQPEADLYTSNGNTVRIYRSPEERREAGLGRQVTDWLKVSTLAEIEATVTRDHFADGKAVTNRERPALVLQLAMQMSFAEWLEAELIFDFETDGKHEQSQLDEAMLGIDLEPWGIKAGRQYVPFGAYYSHFVTGPMLEFGETRADALIFDYTVNGHLELIGYVFESELQSPGSRGFYADWDWGASFELTIAQEAIRIGAGFLSDLSESNERLLADSGHGYLKRVPAWNAYALFGCDGYEVTAEFVRAAAAFREFERNADKPFAWNVELAVFPTQAMQYALRVEHSKELADQPRWRYGISATWRPFKNVSLSLEYLRATYRKGFVLGDDENSLRSGDHAAAQLSLEF